MPLKFQIEFYRSCYGVVAHKFKAKFQNFAAVQSLRICGFKVKFKI